MTLPPTVVPAEGTSTWVWSGKLSTVTLTPGLVAELPRVRRSPRSGWCKSRSGRRSVSQPPSQP